MEGLLASGSGTTRRATTRARAPTWPPTSPRRANGSSGCGPAPAGGDRRGARARVQAADARIAQLEQALKDAAIAEPDSPASSPRSCRSRASCSRAAAASSVVTDLANAWLNVYVSETDLGRIRIDQEATVATDDGQTRKGRVSFVASQAEFTPKNVQTRDERVKLVYKVKVALDNGDGLFKPGMPAEARAAAAAGPGRDRRRRRRAAAAQARRPAGGREPAHAPLRRRAAVSDVSFSVRRGEMFGLIGPDGAGKTTTLRMVLGLLKPDSGEVRTCGLDSFRERRRLSGRVGYLSQQFSLYGDLSASTRTSPSSPRCTTSTAARTGATGCSRWCA